MLRPIRLFSIIVTICAAGPACGGEQKPTAKTGESAARKLVPLRRLACEGSSERLADVNGDGYAKVRHVFDSATPVCSEFDLNLDHHIDLTRIYGKDGKVATEQYDLDFDGRLDMQAYYEAGKMVRKEIDTNFDRMVDTWVWCAGPRISRLERDRHHRGTVDTWEDYKDGLISVARYDDNNDGKPERWETYSDGHLVRVDYDTNHDGKADRSDTDVATTGSTPPSTSTCDGSPLEAQAEKKPSASAASADPAPATAPQANAGATPAQGAKP